MTVPHWAARTAVPVGAEMSLPAWAWEPRFSPKLPVVVPATGEAIWPAPHPAPVDTGAAAGAGFATAWVFVMALRFSAASVDVDGVVVRGVVAVRFDDDFCLRLRLRDRLRS